MKDTIVGNNILTIAGMDPGSANFGFGVLQVDLGCKKKLRYRFREVGMMQNLLREMKGDVRGDLKKFQRGVNRVLREHKVDVIVAERYMNRGIRGNTGELVGMMLGAIVHSARVQDVMLIPASQWKNAFNKNATLTDVYDDCRLVPHVIDACSIALYGACRYAEHKPFEFLQGKGVKKLIANLDKAHIK